MHRHQIHGASFDFKRRGGVRDNLVIRRAGGQKNILQSQHIRQVNNNVGGGLRQQFQKDTAKTAVPSAKFHNGSQRLNIGGLGDAGKIIKHPEAVGGNTQFRAVGGGAAGG